MKIEKTHMKLNKILLSVLWSIALLLAADFWFGVRFGFDILSRAHWRYLANVQTGPDPVNNWFYISLCVFVLLLPLGLYVIAGGGRKAGAPKLESIPAPPNPNPNIPRVGASFAAPPPPPPAPAAPVARPPQMNIPTNVQAGAQYAAAMPAQRPAQAPDNNREPDPESESAARDMVAAAGYIVKKSPKIDGVRLGVWAVGAGEVLVVGIVAKAYGDISAREGGDSEWKDDRGGFKSPVWRLAGVIERLNALFLETLDDEIKVKIKAFVLVEGGRIANADANRAIWSALDIEVFDSADALSAFMNAHGNEKLPEDENEDLKAFGDFMDTVADYFND